MPGGMTGRETRSNLAGVNLLGRKKDNPHRRTSGSADDGATRQPARPRDRPEGQADPKRSQAARKRGPVAPAPMTSAEARKRRKELGGPKLSKEERKAEKLTRRADACPSAARR